MADTIPILTRNTPPQADILNKLSPDLMSEFVNSLKYFTEVFDPNNIKKMTYTTEEKKSETEEIKKEKKVQQREEKSRNSFFDGLKDKFDQFSNKSVEVAQATTKNVSSGLLTGLAGGFNFILEPLKQISGVDVIGGLTDKLSDVFQKKEKVPKRNNVLKEGDIGSVLVADTLRDIHEDSTGKEGGGLLDGILGRGGLPGMLSGLSPLIGKLGLIGGIAWMLVDGVMGFFKADEWGVGKGAGVVGSIFGGLDSGLKGALGGMGKFALLGAGIGSLAFPGVGTIVGGLIGAALGFIMGWIGGENISNALQSIFDDPKLSVGERITKTISQIPKMIVDQLFKFIDMGVDALFNVMGIVLTDEQQQSKTDFFNSLSKIFGSWLDNIILAPIQGFIDGFLKNFRFSEIWGDSEKSIPEKIGESLINLGQSILGGIVGMFKSKIMGMLQFVTDFLEKPSKDGKKANRNIAQSVFNFIFEIPKIIYGFLSGAITGIQTGLKNVPVIGDITQVVGDVLKNIFGVIQDVASGAQDFVDDPLTWLHDVLWVPISRFFGMIGRGIRSFGDKTFDFFIDMGHFIAFMSTNLVGLVTDFEGTMKKYEKEKTTLQAQRDISRAEERVLPVLANKSPEKYAELIQLKYTPLGQKEYRERLFEAYEESPEKFHNGMKITNQEQFAVLRKGEEVLSPSESKSYREDWKQMLMALKELVEVTKQKQNGNAIQINQGTNTFDTNHLRYRRVPN
jgi:hypothetical protein